MQTRPSGRDANRAASWRISLFFFSREEERIHVHVQSADGEAKFWLEPRIELAQNYGLSPRSLRTVQQLIEAHESSIRQAWEAHFGR